ncbi:hypothetical protein [Ensifer sp.]|uniref:hypothetical protein n=1 Tax=Ensifer sp. TaxID=1872086 RepID=UPI00289B8F07|nr:hypothetical protein [Ensifer sp.]
MLASTFDVVPLLLSCGLKISGDPSTHTDKTPACAEVESAKVSRAVPRAILILVPFLKQIERPIRRVWLVSEKRDGDMIVKYQIIRSL